MIWASIFLEWLWGENTSQAKSAVVRRKKEVMALNQAYAPPEWDRLLIACQKNNPKEVRRLITQEGVPASHGNAIKQTALHVASLWGHMECVRVLLEFDANVQAQNTMTGASPLHSCAQ